VSKKSLLGALLVTLACAAGAQADTFLTEQATVNQGIVPPGGGTNLPNVNQINLSGGGGIVLENNITSNGPNVGDKFNLLAAGVIADFTRNPGGSFVADFGGGNKQVVAVFAGQGTVTSLTGGTQSTASIDSGKLALFAIDKNTFDRLNASTWGTAGAAIATFNLTNPADITKGIPNPNDPEAIFFAANQVNTGAINLAAGQQIQDRLLFKDLIDPLIVVQPPFTGQNEGLFGRFDQTALAFAGNPFAGQENTLNGIFAKVNGSGFFQTTGTGTPTDFNPQQLGGTIPADFITQLGGNFVPGILQEGQIPEPASMLLWGAVAGGMGVYGGIRRYRGKKTVG